MTRKPSPRPRPIELAQARADDRLLDAIGLGEPAPAGDKVAVLLASWRADLDDLDELDEVETPVRTPPEVVPIRRRAWSGRAVQLVGAAAVVTAVAAGAAVAATTATPGSPFWPVTRVVNPDRVDTLTAQDTLDQARRAITEGRQADARRLLDQAAGQIAGVRDPAAAKRLRDQLDALRRTLAGLVPGAVGTGPNGAPAPGVPTLAPSAGGSAPAGSGGSTGGAGGGGTGTGGGGTGGGSGGGSGGSTTGPVPTVVPSLPLPSLPVPTIVPTLPLK